MRQLLEANSSNLALVVGNGINLYDVAAGCSGWAELLQMLGKQYLPEQLEIPSGISLTEFYDVLDLLAGKRERGSLQKDFCSLMDAWCPAEQHGRVVGWAQERAVPLITTNFDNLLAQAAGLRQFSLFEPDPAVKAPTDYYPWETYFARVPLDGPCLGFGLWQPHGMRSYHRSIRLGLSHYMGSVERARGWMYRGKQTRLLQQEAIGLWRGKRTWLQIFLCKPLLFFGLSLDENEIFMRWLLIERARYFRKFPERVQPAWYVMAEADEGAGSAGKRFFLESVGVNVVLVPSYDDIYGPQVWQ